MTDPAELYDAVAAEAGEVLVGNEDVLEGVVVAMLVRGHVLLEGVPGVAKTTIANLLARTTGLEYARIQMTPDILPADITGTTVYREATGEFEVREGPVFANLVVADEINRATPKTQSALLEAMQEGAVTIEGDTRPLPDPFTVVATQNPIEQEGTHELPEAQRDRFALKLTVDLPDADEELAILDRFDAAPTLGPADVEQVVDAGDLLAAREVVDEVYVASAVKEYVVDLAGATRDHPDVANGVSPRGSLTLLRAGKATAALAGREYVVPDDIKAIAPAVLAHRLVLDTEAELADVTPEDVIAEVLDTVAPPSAQAATPDTDVVAGED